VSSSYVELHAASAFSFLQGASLPETLVERAVELGYPALALLDRDGVYAAPRFHKAATAAGLRPIIGAELTIADNHQSPLPNHQFPLPVLCETQEGYRNLCRLLTRMHLRSPKGEGALTLEDLDGYTAGLVALVGRAALDARRYGIGGLLERLVGLFGRGSVYVELQRHFRRDEESDNQALVSLASAFQAPLLATNGVRFAAPSARPLYDVLTCIHHRTTLAQAGRRLTPNAERYLKSPQEMAALFSDHPDAVRRTSELADRLQYTMADLGYRFPDYPVPPGETQASFLRKIVEVGAQDRYRPYHDRARAQIARELDLIEKLRLAGYFLIVWDIVNFCRQHDVLVQGRGSAANSAVCYSLGITAVDPVEMDLLFERFLSEERGEWPDIDLDLPSGDRRERVIQHVYEKYGRLGAAMTANVITYRGRSAAREVGKVLGFDAAQVDRLAKVMNHFEFTDPTETLQRHLASVGLDVQTERVRLFARLWGELQDLPRHLGQHSGGMVICQGQLDAVVPLENASMPGRVVVQWDKDDCADMGIVKVDLLGLGMMAVIQDALALVNAQGFGVRDSGLACTSPAESRIPNPQSRVDLVDLAHLPQNDPTVYRLLCEADTIGVFQVESRAQMATLPRLKPVSFYDIVVQVAIIRPGPIVGQMVHPYLNRRAGREPVVYPHPSLEPILKRTLGVPLFQEQLLRIAMVAAGFTGGQAEELRRAFGFKRSERRMKQIEVQLREGMARQGIADQAAEQIITSISSFALYGFPESHAASFALLAYASAYLKVHFPAAFYAALLNNQPMGFYHPSTLVKDAQRRGVRFHSIDVQMSDWTCTVEADGAIRLGLQYVSGLRADVGRMIASRRPPATSRFSSLDQLVASTGLRRDEVVTLADIGALNTFGYDRRSALWQAEQAVRPSGELFAATAIAAEHAEHAETAQPAASECPLRPMTEAERLIADYAGTGLTVGRHPMALRREELAMRGVLRASDLRTARPGRRVRTAGMVITRQRPGTAKGFVFLTLEDETGVANIIVRPDLFARERLAIVEEPFLIVEGVLQSQDGVTSIRAEHVVGMRGFEVEFDAHDFY
jgi:error-prone DNA polymerase